MPIARTAPIAGIPTGSIARSKSPAVLAISGIHIAVIDTEQSVLPDCVYRVLPVVRITVVLTPEINPAVGILVGEQTSGPAINKSLTIATV